MSIIFLAAGGARPRQNLIRVITGNQTEARANNRRDTASHPTLDIETTQVLYIQSKFYCLSLGKSCIVYTKPSFMG